MPKEPLYYDFRSQETALSRRNLPHLTAPGAAYFVTFRLADSMPEATGDRFCSMRKRIENLRAQGKAKEAMYLQSRLTGEEESCLDLGLGACLLNQPDLAKLVMDALLHFEADRYDTYACCLMPNHVHSVFRPLGAWSLRKIVHSWKSFTAHEMVRAMSKRGSVWQHETFDHLVRTRRDLDKFVAYVLANPQKGGLGADWPWVYSSTISNVP